MNNSSSECPACQGKGVNYEMEGLEPGSYESCIRCNGFGLICNNCGESSNNSDTACDECLQTSACCGVEFNKDIRICPDCKEHC